MNNVLTEATFAKNGNRNETEMRMCLLLLSQLPVPAQSSDRLSSWCCPSLLNHRAMAQLYYPGGAVDVSALFLWRLEVVNGTG